MQLVGPEALSAEASVSTLHEATVTITNTRLVATDGTFDWLWMVSDLEMVVHATDAAWTVMVTPDIADFGVAVAAHDVERFRAALATLAGVESKYQHRRQPSTSTAELDLDNQQPPVDAATSSDPASLPLMFVAAVDSALVDIASSAVPAPETARLTPPEPVEASLAERSSLNSSIASVDLTGIDESGISVSGSSSAQPSPASPLRRLVRRGRGEVHAVDQSSTVVNGSVAGLDARNISAWFGSHQVLDRVSLEMPAGKVTALIGPSGCGKSTFLRILNRMHEMIPSAAMAGEVMLDGHDVYDPSRKLTDARREIGMVFQKPNPFPAMSIYDNVVASLRVTGVKASVDVKDALVESCLSKAGLWNEVKDRLRQPGGGLSGGQQQRLCIARALAIKPRVLLMDEPCSALDPTSTRRIEQTIMELACELTIVIVTHNMQQALRVSDRCAFFLAEQGTPGLIVEHGPTELMFRSPQDQRTNDYVNGRFG